MNFFEHQEEARRSTKRLVFLFSLAVITLLTITNALVIAGLWLLDVNSFQSQDLVLDEFSQLKNISDYINLKYIALISALNLTIIGLEIAHKRHQLSGGGKVVAAYVGGREISQNTNKRDERQILNIVEEMAIASGSPVPPVYLLPEQGINAFAAGFNINDAVIGISQGAIQHLNRDQLQGVVAHEFSHILNGDMRLNINLISVLAGIVFIGNTGWFLIRLSSSYSGAYHSRRSSSRSNYNFVFVILGFALVLLGALGNMFGSFIKAAVSRQREFLADASAVQFTRNPLGIADALKTIGSHHYGSRIDAERSHEISHLFFSNAAKPKSFLGFDSWLATHPPLRDRITRIEPRWNGNFFSTHSKKRKEASTYDNSQNKPSAINAATTFIGVGAAVSSAINSLASSNLSEDAGSPETPEDLRTKNIEQLDDSIEYIGSHSEQNLVNAKKSLDGMPASVYEATRDVVKARAVIYLMLLNSHSVNETQLSLATESEECLKAIENLKADFLLLNQSHYLNILELSVPALKQMRQDEFDIFKACLSDLIKADKKVDVFEWLLHSLVIHYLSPQFQKVKAVKSKYRKLDNLRNECKFLLSHLSYLGAATNAAEYQNSFNEGFYTLGLGFTEIVPREQLQTKDLNNAVYQFRQLYPLVKPQLLKACAQCIQADKVVSVEQLNVFRTLAALLDCPMPALSIN